MKRGILTPATGFVVRQSGTLALIALLFAIVQAGRVATALWHGASLHGDYLEIYQNKPYSVLISVWDTFVRALVFGALGLVLLLIAGRRWGLSIGRTPRHLRPRRRR